MYGMIILNHFIGGMFLVSFGIFVGVIPRGWAQRNLRNVMRLALYIGASYLVIRGIGDNPSWQIVFYLSLAVILMELWGTWEFIQRQKAMEKMDVEIMDILNKLRNNSSCYQPPEEK